jgi:eukaryotic-like serine/threonine-protein kinase
MDFKPGDRLGKYVLVGRLGAGGMGQVYKVRNELTARVEAMKTLLPELMANAAVVERFKREIQLLASLHHENIAALYSADELGDQFVMFMEFVDGLSLFERMQQSPLSLDEGIDYILQTLNALQYAHSLPEPVIHRDIKPENLMIARDGKVKVMDFGIAKAVGDINLTQAGTRIGSVRYMPPEQAKGDVKNIDQRSDLYSVGVVLYEIVAGRGPFEHPSEIEILNAHISEPPAPPAQYVPGLSPDLNAVVLKALAKERDQRFQSAQEFIGAIKNCATQPAFAGRQETVVDSLVPSGAQQSRSQRGRTAQIFAPENHRTLYMLLGAVVALVMAVTLTIVGPKFWKTNASGSSAVLSQPSGTVPGTVANLAGGRGQETHRAGNVPVSSENTGHTSPAANTDHTVATTPANPQANNQNVNSLGKLIPWPAANPGGGGNQQEASRTVPHINNNNNDTTNRHLQDDSQHQKLLIDSQSRFVDLKIRADALNSNWGATRDQLKKDGFDLRPNISQSLSRMNSDRDLSEASLHSGDANAAKHYMDLMENEINILEKTGR